MMTAAEEARERLAEIGVDTPDEFLLDAAARVLQWVRTRAREQAPLPGPGTPEDVLAASLRNVFDMDWAAYRAGGELYNRVWQVHPDRQTTASVVASGLSGLTVKGVASLKSKNLDEMAAAVLNELLHTVGGLEARRQHGLFDEQQARRWATNLRRSVERGTALGDRRWQKP